MFRAEFHSSIAEIEPFIWDGLFASDNPFIQHAFLLTLEESGCVSDQSGWSPLHLLLLDDTQPVAVLPMYLKFHSHGEFVFDWGWAQAYERHGLDYYPKLLSAVPFTPSSGPRIGIASNADRSKVLESLVEQVKLKAGELGCSSWHLLFPDEALAAEVCLLKDSEILSRQDVQFHWFNHDYASFEDYLKALRSSRRKNLKRERKAVQDQGVSLERKTGNEITNEDWSAFYQCYCSTYLKRSGHPGYLDRHFFDLLLERMSESLLLVVAKQDEQVVASSLFFFDSQKLYGRYWGCLTDVHCLHFEACFYQGIEFCIENNIAEFDPGTQGEHKLLRGFEPDMTSSYHWIADVRFRSAISNFLEDEKKNTQAYGEQAAAFLPFRKDK
ncbi:MAG: putative N-acyltransferase [Lysobacterales bacterium]|jgi:predicted N-acyltransferase